MSNKPLTKTEWLAALEELWEAAQQPRPWVGLTDDEIALLYMSYTDRPMKPYWKFARAIEAKLKEKNDH